MLSKDQLTIANDLLDLGCCKYCALRLLSQDLDFVKCAKYLEEQNDEVDESGAIKRRKMNPCILCVDLLDESFISEVVTKLPEKIKEYDSETFNCCISFPCSIDLRQRQLEFYVEQKYAKLLIGALYPRTIAKVWKAIAGPMICKTINKKLEQSPFTMQFNFNYKYDEEETTEMYQFIYTNAGREFTPVFQVPMSKTALSSLLYCKGIKDRSYQKVLEMFLSKTPNIPEESVTFRSIDLKAESIYIGGRYCKYSRQLGQTPWLHGNTNITACVQEYIFSGLHKVFGYPKESMTFSAAGREDYDARCLGKGRPFYIEISNPTVTKIPFIRFRELEKEIAKCGDISVRDMQFVKSVHEIKNGEQCRTKHYEALCIVNSGDVEKMVSTLNAMGSFEIMQETPIRVMHRRTMAIRRRRISETKARTVPGRDNLFILNVLTEAGTYVKELIHGDLHRTRPSLSEILGAEIDILALDVKSVDLDWPPPVTEAFLKENEKNNINLKIPNISSSGIPNTSSSNIPSSEAITSTSRSDTSVTSSSDISSTSGSEIPNVSSLEVPSTSSAEIPSTSNIEVPSISSSDIPSTSSAEVSDVGISELI